MWRQSVVLSLLVIGLGCQSTSTRRTIPLHKNPDDMRKEILKHVPLGTSLPRACTILENEDFEKLVVEDDSAARDDSQRFAPPIPTPYMSGESEDRTVYTLDAPTDFLVTGTWVITVHHDSLVVTDVSVDVNFTGP